MGVPSDTVPSGAAGRYDGLVGRFRARPFRRRASIGVSRLLAALQAVKSPIVSESGKPGPVVVLVMDRAETAAYQRMVSRLREAGIRAELYLGSSGMKAQMKYADRRGSPCVIIQGSDEHARGEVQVKDLVEGSRAAETIASNEEWKAARRRGSRSARTSWSRRCAKCFGGTVGLAPIFRGTPASRFRLLRSLTDPEGEMAKAKAKSSKKGTGMPKKVAGVKVPKAMRQSKSLGTLLNSGLGREILADALIAAAGAAAAA